MVDESKFPWRRLAFESVTIVASILLAFAIEAWWSDRQQAEEEDAILAAIAAEARELGQSIRDFRTYVTALRESSLRLYRVSVEPNPQIPDAEFDRLLNDVLWRVGTDETNAPVLESLTSSGDMEVVSNGELRRRIGRIVVTLRGWRFDIGRDSEYYDRTVIPFIQAQASMAQLFDLESSRPGFPDEIYPSIAVDLPARKSHRELVESREFQNILLQRYTTLTNILSWEASYLEEPLREIADLAEGELRELSD